jgi:hypothetical protein
MNKSQRIYVNETSLNNDKYIKFKLEQDVDSFEFLSLNVSLKDAYNNFNSEYGVLVGRVLANNGIGIPNARISIFIPVSDEDVLDDELYSIYPYKTPRDKNNYGKRYNLLPRVGIKNPNTSIVSPRQPFGSFPIKEEILFNEKYLEVYKKYYKYTALTNNSGDYMIFGVPVGTQTVHLSVDTTDIGKYSMTPASMITSLGYSQSLFTDNGTKIKESDDLNDLPNIETQDISVDIIPFWGNEDIFEIGVTRQDFRIRATLTSTFTIFGSTMTMGAENTIGNPDIRQDDYGMMMNIPRATTETDRDKILSGSSAFTKENFRTGKPIIDVFTVSTDIKFNSNPSKVDELFDFNDTDTDIVKLDKSQYYEYTDSNGNFILVIPCNRRRVVINNLGEEEVVDENRNDGILTRFYGMLIIDYENLSISKKFTNNFYSGNQPGGIANINRARLKIPQNTNLYANRDGSDASNNDKWRKSHKMFKANSYYSVAQFLPVLNLQKFQSTDFPYLFDGCYNGRNPPKLMLIQSGTTNVMNNEPINANFRVYQTGLYFDSKRDDNNMLNNKISDSKLSDTGNTSGFGGQWMNMCLLFPQYVWTEGYEWYNRVLLAAPYLHDLYNDVSYKPNSTKLFAGLINSERFIRGDYNQTAFIEIPKDQLIKFEQEENRALNIGKYNDGKQSTDPSRINLDRSRGELLDTSIKDPGVFYRRPRIPTEPTLYGDQGYRLYGHDSNYYTYTRDTNGYFFKGLKKDCVKLLYELGFVI